MKKAFTLLTAVLLFAVTLTGCIRNDLGITINKNGTGSVAASIGIEKSAYDQLVSMGTDPFEGKKTENVKYGDETYVTYTETKEYASYDEVKTALLDMTYNSDKFKNIGGQDEEQPDESGYTLYTPAEEKKDDHIFSSVDIDKTEGIFYSVYTFRATVNPRESEDDLTDGSFKLTITVDMPDKITQSKGGTVDGKTIVFDFDELNEQSEIAAVSEGNNYGVIIGIVAVLLIVAAVFVIVIKRKK